MDEAEQDVKEEFLAFPEVCIKEEPRELQLDLDDDYEGRNGFEDDDGEEVDEGSRMEEMLDYGDAGGLHDDDDEYDHMQDGEHMFGDDGDMQYAPMPGETKCGLCQREYTSAASLKAHLSKKHKLAVGPCFTCHLCGAIGQTRATLKRHLLRTHGQSSLSDHHMLKKCQHCGVGYITLMDLNTHIAEAHAELLAQYHQCPHCPALFRTRHTMLRHIGRRHPNADLPCLEQEKCQECQQTFPTRTALRLHIKTQHPDALIHKCPTCSATFKYSYMLRRHIKNIHEKEQQQKLQPPKEQQRYKCGKCPREYRCKTHLQKHLDNAHLNPKEPQVFHCGICNAAFATGSRRNRHTRMVHRDRSRPRCSECNQFFNSVEEFNIHRQTHRMKCGVCDKTFLRRDTLREHLLIHNGPRLPCPYCPKKFTQGSNLKRHIRVHTGEKPYKCSYCSRRFGDKSACNSHMRVHTGAERCSCQVCGASFSKRQKLNYHMRKHTGEGLLHCPLCTSNATNSYSLRKHMESHQSVLVGLLQAAQTPGKPADIHHLARHTLQNLAWVTVKANANDQAASQRPAEIKSPISEDKVKECEEKSPQIPSSDSEKDKKLEVEDSDDMMTALENVEVIVKVEKPDEVDESQSLSNAEESSANLTQFRHITKKMNILIDPDDEKDVQLGKMTERDIMKADLLSCALNVRCTQFNDAVEKLKLLTAVEEENALNNETEDISWNNDDDNTDGVRDFQTHEELEAVNGDPSNYVKIKEENVDTDMLPDGVLEQTGESAPALMEEPIGFLARLWQHMIQTKEAPQHIQRITQLSNTYGLMNLLQTNSDKNSPGSVLGLGNQSEPEEEENMTCSEARSGEVIADNEMSECDNGES